MAKFYFYYSLFSESDRRGIIKWLGLPNEYPDLEKYKREQAVNTLQVFKEAWQPRESLPRLRNDLEKQIARVVSKG